MSYCLVLVNDGGRELPLLRDKSSAFLEALAQQVHAHHPATRWRITAWQPDAPEPPVADDAR
jgi:hypothetical protein